MSNVTVCVRFRPPSPKEKEAGGENLCVQGLDAECFLFKAGRKEELAFCFDRVFYHDSAQVDVYEFLAMPTGAGKTYSMEGPSISDCDAETKGLLPRVVNGIFEYIKSAEDTAKYTVKISMVEIYMEKVRDLFNLSKDNLQIKENRTHGIFLSGVTEVTILDPEEALRCLSRGIASRAVGETQMNMASSRSHCVYTFLVHQESSENERSRTGKLVLVDLAGSEKVEKTGAEGRILDEARTINMSLSALGNVINALTTGKVNHIPYRDSKLTRILQDALGGNSRTALLCCCSPSTLNVSESLSTLRFGTRTKLIKTPLQTHVQTTETTPSPDHNRSRERILAEPSLQLKKSLKPGEVDLLEELCRSEGSLLDPDPSDEEVKSADEDAAGETDLFPEETMEMVKHALEEITATYRALMAERDAEQLERNHVVFGKLPNFFGKVLRAFRWL
ncbi:hypothetical protein Taro_019214 [Colocasia esculenta]|uniref:Kinesin-like protein n=1 Tax=Colocasia esculenta TaxID=4460 RepID=A0A843UKJ3_COLES|nr:hypothetical protein [Colocasia esculenta]